MAREIACGVRIQTDFASLMAWRRLNKHRGWRDFTDVPIKELGGRSLQDAGESSVQTEARERRCARLANWRTLLIPRARRDVAPGLRPPPPRPLCRGRARLGRKTPRRRRSRKTPFRPTALWNCCARAMIAMSTACRNGTIL